MVDVDVLKMIVALAEEKSISLAAKRLNVSAEKVNSLAVSNWSLNHMVSLINLSNDFLIINHYSRLIAYILHIQQRECLPATPLTAS